MKISRYTRWSNYDLLIMAGVGIAIGVILSLLFVCSCPTTIITDHKVLIDNFLGYKELIVVKVLQ